MRRLLCTTAFIFEAGPLMINLAFLAQGEMDGKSFTSCVFELLLKKKRTHVPPKGLMRVMVPSQSLQKSV